MEGHRISIFSPKFVGERFNSHRLPLDVLGDLAMLQTMTIEMAKHLFIEENPSRQRVPKNFTNGISFELENIQPGSTIPVIVLVTTLAGATISEDTRFFEQAKDKIIDAVQAASDGENALNHAPQSVLRYFSKIGMNLREDEFIQFNPDGEFKAKLDRESRRRLIQASSSSKEYTEKVVLRGYISEMDQRKRSFHFEFPNGQRLEGLYSDSEEEAIRMSFYKYSEKQKVMVAGIGKFNHLGKIIAIDDIEEVVLLEDMDVGFRLEQLSALKSGWLDGQGVALDQSGLKWLANAFEEKYGSNLPLPAVFPTPDGKIQAEWSFSPWEISLTIDLTTRIASFDQVNTDTDEDSEDELNLNNSEDWATISEAIRKKSEKGQ